MVNSIDQALVTQFSDMVHIQAEQMVSRLRGKIKEMPVRGNDAAYERLDTSGLPQEITGRHEPTVAQEVTHSRRQIKMRDFAETYYLDRFDELQVLIDPARDYAATTAYKMMRQYDKLALDAALGTVKTGKNFGTSVTAASDGVTTVTATSGLTYDKCLEIKENFINNEVGVDDNESIILAITGQQHTNLMKEVEFTSADFSKGFVIDKGVITKVLGMDVIVFSGGTNSLLNKSGSVRDCIAMSTRGVVVGVNQDITIDVDKRPDLNNLQQVQARFFLGATRTEGKLVQKIQCTEV